jgi:hypothetical protein
MSRILFSLTLILLTLALAACGGAATPQLIGSYPQGGEGQGGDPYSPPIGGYYPPPQNLFIAYNASLELEVEHPSYTVYSVRSVAEQYHGYLLNSRTWRKGGDEYAEATVAVPVSNFEAVRSRIKSLGEVKSESVSGELRDSEPGLYGGAENFSHITVTLSPASANWGRRIGAFFTGVMWFLFAITPPILMLIGLITVIRTVMGWVQKRRTPQL